MDAIVDTLATLWQAPAYAPVTTGGSPIATLDRMDSSKDRKQWDARIATRLRDLMISRGYSFQKLADGIGRTKGAVQKWVEGARSIDVPTAVSIAGVFDVTPAYILCLDSPEAPTLTEAEQRLIAGLRLLRREYQEELLQTVEGLAKIRSIGAPPSDDPISRASVVSRRIVNKKSPNAATGLVARTKSRTTGGGRH